MQAERDHTCKRTQEFSTLVYNSCTSMLSSSNCPGVMVLRTSDLSPYDVVIQHCSDRSGAECENYASAAFGLQFRIPEHCNK